MSRRFLVLGGALILVLGLAVAGAQNLRAQGAEVSSTPTSLPAAGTAQAPYVGLTDEQVEALQAARNDVLDARLRLLEKQAEFGLIDPSLVEAQRERIAWFKEAPWGMGQGTAWGCPGYGPQGGRGFGGRRGGGRGPAAGGWGMMGPGW